MRDACENIPCILVANKIDIDYQVTRKNFKFASSKNIPFYFVSAADGTNVVKVFRAAVESALDYKDNGDFMTGPSAGRRRVFFCLTKTHRPFDPIFFSRPPPRGPRGATLRCTRGPDRRRRAHNLRRVMAGASGYGPPQ